MRNRGEKKREKAGGREGGESVCVGVAEVLHVMFLSEMDRALLL